MSKTVVVFSCAHASPDAGNERFDWLGKFIYDLKPNMVIDLGDGADMSSLNSYDKGKPQAIVAQNYEADINVYNDSQERLRHQFRYHRKGKPMWVGFEGNHEHRIQTAISHDPRLEGSKYGISFSHLQTNRWFDEYHPYKNSAPSIANYDGVDYAHYFAPGNSGRAAAGTHHAYGLLNARNVSSTCGHSHIRNIAFKDGARSPGLISTVVGCYKGKEESWAGQSNLGWWKGVLIKREVADGMYEPQFISMNTLKEHYS
tara:strand:- start:157 stop:930 length:774 start_codon:yes stop_codon:yes gene_type:complete